MSYFANELLPALASTLKGWRGTVRALTPELLAKMLKQHGHPDEANYVAKMREGEDFRGMIQQAIAFSREGDQQDWEREDRHMDTADRIHRFVTEHTTPLDERVTMQRKATDVAAKATRRKEKLARKGERGAERLRAKKYRHSAAGKKAIARRSKAQKKLSPTALKKKNVIHHYQPQTSSLTDLSFGKLVHELRSIALVTPVPLPENQE